MVCSRVVFVAIVFALFSLTAHAATEDVCYDGYPKQAVAARLQSGEKITLDGILDEAAWKAVGDIGPLSDIEGESAPSKKPWLGTTVKLRWDDQCLYVGASMEEPSASAWLLKNNTALYTGNDFEVLADPAGQAHHYKELEVNAAHANWGILMVRPYLDGGPAVCNNADLCSRNDPAHGVTETWDSAPTLRYGTYVDGALNDPSRGSKSWGVELCIPLSEWARYETGTGEHVPPAEGDMWRINFLRVQYRTRVTKLPNGTLVYEKIPGTYANNWAWQPTGVPNIHLPDRWGIVQFANSPATPAVLDPTFPVRRALRAVYEAENIYSTMYGHGYTDSLDALVNAASLPAFVAKGTCASVPAITVTSDGFVAKVSSLDGHHFGSITADRQITMN